MLGHGSVMGCDDGGDAFFDKVVEDRSGQRRSFFRVGPGSQLIEKYQGAVVGFLQDVHDGAQMG